MLTITGIRHAWPEQSGFCLNRKQGHPDYSFVHFISSVEIHLNGETIMVPNHACIIYRPGTPQHFVSQNPLLHDWFHFSGAPEPIFEKLNLLPNTLLYPKRWNFITDLVQEMESEFFAQKNHHEELLTLKITELFIKLSRSLCDESIISVDNSTSERLRKLRSKVLLSLNHPWTVAEMASSIPLSESRFYSVYRSFYGISPIDDLIHARIDAAKNALLFTDQTICDIAESLGYSNVTHFIRQFRSITGISPARYRKMNFILERGVTEKTLR